MALKGTPSWLCISSQTQCFGNFSFREKMWRIHTSWLSLDKKQATSPASNPVALAARTTSPLLQVDPDLSLAWWAIFKPWHASPKSCQMAFPNAKNFLGAGFGFNKVMVSSKTASVHKNMVAPTTSKGRCGRKKGGVPSMELHCILYLPLIVCFIYYIYIYVFEKHKK